MIDYRSYLIRRIQSFWAYLLSVVIIVVLLASTIHHPVAAQSNELEIVAEFPAEHSPGNIAITPEGRLIMSQHQFYGAPLRVVEVLVDILPPFHLVRFPALASGEVGR